MTCHHIDWGGLQIKVDVSNGQLDPTYTCILCEKEMKEPEYKDLIKILREKKEDNTLRFWRTPKGKEHILEECVEPKQCFVHEGEEND